MDESMSGWRPNITKLGGLPNYTFDPQKLFCWVLCLGMVLDIYQGIFYFKILFKTISISMQIIIKLSHQVYWTILKSRRIQQTWQRIVGLAVDAWLGSIVSCAELRKQLNVHYTFIVKHNASFILTKAFHKILQVRYEDRPVGYWLVMHMVLFEVPIFVLVYAQSQ